MQSLRAAVLRFGNAAVSTSLRHSLVHRSSTRSMWQLTKQPGSQAACSMRPQFATAAACNFQLPSRSAHSKCESDLVEFITHEIIAERKNMPPINVPATLNGFAVNLSGADVELTKENPDEKIKIIFSVNNSVNAEELPGADNNDDAQPGAVDLSSKPEFNVDITRGNRTLSIGCSFFEGATTGQQSDDIFHIDNACIYDNAYAEKVYETSADFVDEKLYDLFYKLLQEKGIDNAFVKQLSELATAHERNLYIKFLEKLSKFTIDNAQ